MEAEYRSASLSNIKVNLIVVIAYRVKKGICLKDFLFHVCFSFLFNLFLFDLFATHLDLGTVQYHITSLDIKKIHNDRRKHPAIILKLYINNQKRPAVPNFNY